MFPVLTIERIEPMNPEKHLPDPRQNKMGTMPVGKLLFNMATPMILSMLVQALYNVVDTFFVAQIYEDAALTDKLMAAMSLAFPIQNLQIGFGTGIAVGVNALLSKSLGQGNRDQANRAAGNGIFLVAIATVAFMLFGIFGSRMYYSTMSDDALIIEAGSTYTTICCTLTVGVFVSILCERLLQATGRATLTMLTQGTGAIVNIILDPILILGLDMGIAGAAYATVIGQFCGAAVGIFFNLKKNPDIQFGTRYVKPDPKTLGPILTVGVPSVVMVAIGSVMNLGMTTVLNTFKAVKVAAVGVFGTYFKLQSFFFMPLFGLNNATISIVAFNYGARNKARIVKTLRLAVLTALGFMLAGLAVFQLVPDVLLGLFEPSEEFMAIGVKALRIISWHFPLAAIGIALGASFQALGNGIYSTIVSCMRQMVALLPAAYLLSLSGNVAAVWWSFPIAEVVSVAFSLIFFIRIYRQKIRTL